MRNFQGIFFCRDTNIQGDFQICISVSLKLNWICHNNVIATQLKPVNAMLYKVKDFANANILKSIMHYLNHILTKLASYGGKTLAQSTVELSILKSEILTHLLCFITGPQTMAGGRGGGQREPATPPFFEAKLQNFFFYIKSENTKLFYL